VEEVEGWDDEEGEEEEGELFVLGRSEDSVGGSFLDDVVVDEGERRGE
jgi:hypothetical protein